MARSDSSVARMATVEGVLATIVAVTTLLTLALPATAAVASRRTSQHDLVKANVQLLLDLQAKGPQPRAVDVIPQLKNMKPSENVIPHQTVLHRCDMLACCGDKNPAYFHCVPAVENVSLYFQVTDVRSRPIRQRRIVHEFQNHTRCDCVTKEILTVVPLR